MVLDNYFSAKFDGPDVHLRKAMVYNVVRIDDGMVTVSIEKPGTEPYFLLNCSWIKRKPRCLWVVTDGNIWFPAMDIHVRAEGISYYHIELCQRHQYEWVRLGRFDHRVILKALGRYCNSLS